MKKQLLIASAALIAMMMACCPKNNQPTYLNEDAPLEERVEDALSRMTLEEKVAILHAQSKFSSPGVPRLGIPELWCTDGPHGIRPEVKWDEWDQAGWTNDSIVAFPALTCLAATWNTDMAALYGKSIGEEARYREKDVLLGPGVNIYRTPLCGRNFEYMGEDPYLAGVMATEYIKGVQKNGVAACVKHYALNNEERHRHTIDVDVDERALHEIYLPAFKMAVQEGESWSIMSSYNLFRGRHVSQDTLLTQKILKDTWGFDGAVISDWGAVHDADEAATSGMDLEFGTHTDGLAAGTKNAYDNYYLAQPYLKGLKEGRYSMDLLNDKARRVLRLIMRTAMNTRKPFGNICSQEHYDAARKIAGEGIVLLKNDNNVLPLQLENNPKILVVGENAYKMMTVGGGSSSLKVRKEIIPLEGLKAAFADKATLVYERGYVGDVTTTYNGVWTGQVLEDERSPEKLIADAVAQAADADYILFFGGLNKSWKQDCEGRDRVNMDLPYGQDAVIEALAACGKKMAVILIDGNAVTMPWVEKVPAIVQAWYIGTEAGEAIADVLTGAVNPSGKLPFTFPVALSDSPAHQEGMTFPNNGKTFYEEGIYVGYRWFNKKNIQPLFAFGHGLSYTSFEFEAAKGDKSLRMNGKLNLSVKVTNTGDKDGSEVVQVYIQDIESSLERPEKELKAFKKVFLKAGESKVVKFTLDADDLKFYDPAIADWKAEKGEFVAHIGAASDDIRTSVKFYLK